MGIFNTLIFVLSVWCLIGLTIKTYEEHRSLNMGSVHIGHWDFNQFINQMSFSIFGKPLYTQPYASFTLNFGNWINTPRTPYFGTWIHVNTFGVFIYN